MSPARDPLPLLEVRDRAALRAWLDANHATSKGVHLAIGRKGTAVTSLTYEEAVEEALAFGWIDSTSHALDADRHTVQFTPRKTGGNWSRSNKVRVARLIEQGLMTPAGLVVVEAAKADGSWNALDDVEAMVMPADLTQALAAEPNATQAWEAESVSQRKISLYWIGNAKRPETRSRRISEVVRAAVDGRRLW